MKKIVVTGAVTITSMNTLHREFGKDFSVEGEDDLSVSDGYHTFDELYDHRITLWIALCRKLSLVMDKFDEEQPFYEIWRTPVHSDGSQWSEWFILGIGKEKGKQITYHIPVHRWAECDFAETLDKAPDFDGHTSDDVLARLKTL